MIFLILFVVIPLIETAVFIAVGREIGVAATLALCIAMAVFGSLVMRRQGLDALFRGRETLEEGFLPAEELFDGFCIVVAGVLLIAPGFVTDALGFLLLIPAVRRRLRTVLARKFDIYVASEAPSRSNPAPPGDVIEGDYERLDGKDRP